MRSPRIVVAVLAVALAGSMAAIPTSASARVDSRPAVAVQKAETATKRAETSIKSTKVVKKRPAANKPAYLYLQGKVYGEKGDGKVAIQVATLCDKAKGTCNFRYYRTTRLNSDSIFLGRISAPPTRRSYLWRARIGDATSDIWQTCTKRATENCVVPYK